MLVVKVEFGLSNSYWLKTSFVLQLPYAFQSLGTIFKQFCDLENLYIKIIDQLAIKVGVFDNDDNISEHSLNNSVSIKRNEFSFLLKQMKIRTKYWLFATSEDFVNGTSVYLYIIVSILDCNDVIMS